MRYVYMAQIILQAERISKRAFFIPLHNNISGQKLVMQCGRDFRPQNYTCVHILDLNRFAKYVDRSTDLLFLDLSIFILFLKLQVQLANKRFIFFFIMLMFLVKIIG